MENKLIIIGNSSFSKEYYTNGDYKVNNSPFLNYLYKNYEIDNLSTPSLTTKKALNRLKLFVNNYDYNKCIISLGSEEVIDEDFKNNLEAIVTLLIDNFVEPILISIDSQIKDSSIGNNYINELRSKYNLSSSIVEKTTNNTKQNMLVA